jgi:hypothetical protein
MVAGKLRVAELTTRNISLILSNDDMRYPINLAEICESFGRCD